MGWGNGPAQGLGFGIFFFHSFGKPLLDHRLIVQVATCGEAFQPTEHSGIDAQSNGGGFLSFAAGKRGGEERWIELVVGPVVGLFLGIGKEGDFFPLFDLREFAHRDSLDLRS